MALRQRTWVILLRPYHINNSDEIMHYTSVPQAGRRELGMHTSGTNTPVDLQGVGEGMEDWNTIGVDEGGWTMWYATTSYPRLREKYEECLKNHPRNMIRIAEIMPVDIMATPRS